MAKAFYMKLSVHNLVRNRRIYGPYCVASALMSAMFFIILNLVFSRSITNLEAGQTVQMMFRFGIVVMSLFTVGYILYINSFLVKRRKKEFGLYAVLGMERRHVARVILWENAILSIGSLLLGLLAGAVFGRLAFMILLNILDTAPGSTYELSGSACAFTVGIFSVIFVLTTLYNLNQVRLASPVSLLAGEHKGEKKVRFILPLTILGTAALGVAYYLSITAKNSSNALLMFWPAVILVIVATWMLFTGGSVFLLGALKRNRRLYYKPGNFIAISGLIHRMKQNAAGLANICVLSTMVMVTVSCCCSLFLGQEDILLKQNPNDILFTVTAQDQPEKIGYIETETKAAATVLAVQHGITLQETYVYSYKMQSIAMMDCAFIYRNAEGAMDNESVLPQSAYKSAYVILLEDYNTVLDLDETLERGEALLLANGDVGTPEEIPLSGGVLTIKRIETDTLFTRGKNSAMDDRLVIVVSDEDTQALLLRSMNPARGTFSATTAMVFNVEGDKDACYQYNVELHDAFLAAIENTHAKGEGAVSYNTSNIYLSRVNGYSLYGGLLFLGVFFTILFLINTVLIIYFKQISEGFDDCERFEIMQKVGLSDREVRKTVNRQTLTVFLLPLIVALTHTMAASNMIQQMLGAFMLTNFSLTLRCILVTCAVFILVYLCVYRLTARTYYRLVRW